MDISDQAIFTDYFILCSGDNKRLLNALAEDVVEAARERAERRPQGSEGNPTEGWMLVDFGDVIVHLFTPEQRSYYGLEELWSDARVMIRVQ